MKNYQPKFKPDADIEAFCYDPSKSDPMPQGFSARATSRGAEAMFQRPDGIVFHMSPFDWAIRINGGPWFVLHEPCFRELFKEQD